MTIRMDGQPFRFRARSGIGLGLAVLLSMAFLQTARAADKLRAAGGDERVATITGSRATLRFTGPQIRRFFKTSPAEWQRTAEIHLVSSFIPSLLVGKSVSIDLGDGAGMNLLDLAKADWSDSLLEATAPGLRQKLKPPVASTASALLWRRACRAPVSGSRRAGRRSACRLDVLPREHFDQHEQGGVGHRLVEDARRLEGLRSLVPVFPQQLGQQGALNFGQCRSRRLSALTYFFFATVFFAFFTFFVFLTTGFLAAVFFAARFTAVFFAVFFTAVFLTTALRLLVFFTFLTAMMCLHDSFDATQAHTAQREKH